MRNFLEEKEHLIRKWKLEEDDNKRSNRNRKVKKINRKGKQTYGS